jgi:hypothetical protein
MHKSTTKCNETIGKWCKNKHGASKIIDTFETYQISELDNSIYQFGRHNHEGWALRTPGHHENLPWTEMQLEDMGSYAFNLEDMLHSEMDAMDDAKYQLLQKDEKIGQLETMIEKLKEKNKSLEAANDKLSGKVEDQEA